MADTLGNTEEPNATMTEVVKSGDPKNGKDEVHDVLDDTTWMEVCQGCFCHSPIEWFWILFRLFWVLFFLFWFIVALDILGAGAAVFTGCVAGELFGDDQNPLTGLMIGILLTVCMQSSSTTTSITVSLVGAGAIGVKSGIYIIMGANIGTSVTSTIVAIGQMNDDDQFERAFAGATVNDMFNYLAVAVLFPLELISGMLYAITKATVKNMELGNRDRRSGFVRTYIRPIGQAVINFNRRVTDAVATGSATCEDFYPTSCEDPDNPTAATCSVGLIRCNDNGCPLFFESGADRNDDELAGLCCFFVGIAMLFICLGGLVFVLSKMLLGGSTRIIHKATNINGYIAILIGAGITIAVQSSSITTAALTPLAGLGIVSLDQMFPLTLGANIGTTFTGLMAALAGSSVNALQVALAHLFFNLFGIAIWYPLPVMRRVPVFAAQQLGKTTRAWKGFAFVYLAVLFCILPLLLFAVSEMFSSDDSTQIAIATVVVVILAVGSGYGFYWWYFKDGKATAGEYFANRKRRVAALETIPYDLHWAHRKTKDLQNHTSSEPAQKPVSVPINDPYATVADDMKFVMETVDSLIEHTGLPADEDDHEDKDGDGKHGRFVHKENEIMPEVDMSGWFKWQLSVTIVILAVLGLIAWGVAALWQLGSVAGRGTASFILILVGTFVLYRLVWYVTSGAMEYSQAQYKDIELKKACKGTYIEEMAQLTADLDKLVAVSGMPVLASRGTRFGSDASLSMKTNDQSPNADMPMNMDDGKTTTENPLDVVAEA